MKTVVNDALRLGPRTRSKPLRPHRFKVEPHAFGFKAGIDTDRLHQLVDELEAELHSTDADMARFPGLRWTNPLT